MFICSQVNCTVSSIPTQGTPSKSIIQTSYSGPPQEVIEISDSEEPDSSKFTGMNQDPINLPPASPVTRTEIIEVLSSDAEAPPQSPLPPPPPLPNMTQVLPGRLGLQNLPITPLQDSPPLPFQLPLVSSPHEVESMVDTLSSPTLPPISSSHHVKPVEDSEVEGEVAMEDTHEADDPQAPPASPADNSIIQSDDELPSLPPPSSSSPSCQIQISRGPTPTVRSLLYGGPNGIFRDANLCLLQHMQARPNQNTPPTYLIPGSVDEAGTPPVSCAVFYFNLQSDIFIRHQRFLRQLTLLVTLMWIHQRLTTLPP